MSLCKWVFDDFMLAEELFAKSFRSLETCVLIIIYEENYSRHYDHQQHLMKVTSVPFFIPDFDFLSRELDIFTFKVLYWVILY